MNKVLSILAMAIAILIGSNAYAQSAANDAPAAPQKQCAKGGAAGAGCCKDKAGTAAAAGCCKNKAGAAASAGCTKGQAAAANADAKCTNHYGTSASVEKQGESEVLGEKMSDNVANTATNKKAMKAAAKLKRNAAKAKAEAPSAAAAPGCQKGAAGAKCCKDKAAAGATNNLKVAEQK